MRRWFQVPVLREKRARGRIPGRPVLVVRVPAGGLDGPRVPVELGPKSDPGVHGRRRLVPVLSEKVRGASRRVSTTPCYSGGGFFSFAHITGHRVESFRPVCSRDVRYTLEPPAFMLHFIYYLDKSLLLGCSGRRPREVKTFASPCIRNNYFYFYFNG